MERRLEREFLDGLLENVQSMRYVNTSRLYRNAECNFAVGALGEGGRREGGVVPCYVFVPESHDGMIERGMENGLES